MRKGLNPHKDKVHEPIGFFHQVVVPVYIPNQEEYFKDSFTILKYCLSSLFKTSHNKTYFTIVNNGSCIEVKEYLDNLFNTNQIHEIVNTSNIHSFSRNSSQQQHNNITDDKNDICKIIS